MDLPFNLAGSFGEPRPDHFHSGIDIKTNGAEGQPVFAVGDGYISRIRVSPYGYGRAIYITHTNGYTSVYGHLSRFNAALEKYVHQQHYLKKTSELDLYPASSLFPVKQKDTIAFSGNTGGSTAPHLHFEIRDSKTEIVLNPLDFYPKGFYVDTIPPQINKVKFYQFVNSFYMPYSGIEKPYINIEPVINNGKLTTSHPFHVKNTTALGYRYCFSLEGFDKQDNSENKNGIYKIDVVKGKDTVFKYILNEIDFDKTRMCNAFVDYSEMMNDSGYFYNCYQLPNNTLPIYTSGNNGFYNSLKDDSMQLQVFCYDYNENKTELTLTFVKDKNTTNILQKNTDTIFTEPHSKHHTISNYTLDSISLGNIKFNFSPKTFYDQVQLSLGEAFTLEPDENYHTDVYYIYGSINLIPLQKAAKIEFTSPKKKNRNKGVIVRGDNKDNLHALKTTSDKTKFYAETRELGTFYLDFDTAKPIIQLKDIKDNKIQAKITDELSGIQSYNGYIDGQWVNFYYDAKNDLITYNFDEYCKPGDHNLKLVVSDAKGNTTIFTQHFKN